MHRDFIRGDTVGPVHVAAMKGPRIFAVHLFTEQPSSVVASITAEWCERDAFFFSQSTLGRFKTDAAEGAHFWKFNIYRVVKKNFYVETLFVLSNSWGTPISHRIGGKRNKIISMVEEQVLV